MQNKFPYSYNLNIKIKLHQIYKKIIINLFNRESLVNIMQRIFHQIHRLINKQMIVYMIMKKL